MTVAIRRAMPEDVAFLAELVTHEDVEPFLAAVRAKDTEELLAEVERSQEEPDAFGVFVIEVDGERAGTMRFERTNLRSRIASLGGLALHPAFRGLMASVFSVPSPASSEELVVVQEVRESRLDGTAPAELAEEVGAVLGRSLGLPVGNVVFVKPGRVRRTTSGKVQRSLMRDLFVGDGLEPLYEVLNPRTRDRYRPQAAPAADGRTA